MAGVAAAFNAASVPLAAAVLAAFACRRRSALRHARTMKRSTPIVITNMAASTMFTIKLSGAALAAWISMDGEGTDGGGNGSGAGGLVGEDGGRCGDGYAGGGDGGGTGGADGGGGDGALTISSAIVAVFWGAFSKETSRPGNHSDSMRVVGVSVIASAMRRASSASAVIKRATTLTLPATTVRTTSFAVGKRRRSESRNACCASGVNSVTSKAS